MKPDVHSGSIRNTGLRRWALAGLLLLAAGPLAAAEGLHLGGFGTLGFVTDNRSNIAPARDIGQQPADSFKTGSSWVMDSRLGLQVEYGLSPTLDLVGQFILRDHFQSDFESSTELAYAAWRPSPDLDIRAGRINYDAFLLADHRNVGYAYPWIRPPAEFYGWIPIFSVDGLDAAYDLHGDEARWRFKAQLGRSEFAIPIGRGYQFKTNDLRGVSVTRQSDRWRLKAAYSEFTVDSEVPDLVPLQAGLGQVAAAGIPQVSAEAADLRRNLTFKGTRVSYTTLGAAYDDGRWLAQAELGVSTATAAVVPHATMAYASLGRRFGDWTPSLTLSTSHPGNKVRDAASDWGPFNAALRDPALFTLNTTRIEQDTVSLGLRWDFHRQAALKLQWDSTLVKPSGYGLWWRELSVNGRSSRIEMLSATVDFAF
ncbi:MAG TPA: hypothetical protein VI279_02770 [Rhodocyclaceae bacterium]